MDYIREIVNSLGVIPSVAGAGIIALLVYSIFFSGKGGGNGAGSGPKGGVGSPTPPPPAG